MSITSRFLFESKSWLFLAALNALVACTTDDTDPAQEAANNDDDGAGPAADDDGAGPSPGSDDDSTGPAADDDSTEPAPSASGGDTVCSNPIALDSSTPGIADFDNYDGASTLSSWSVPLGGDASLGVFTGPFGYGDRSNGKPETFDMTDGNDSEYALRIADSKSVEYGGGMGLWMSECLDASAFDGISFWVRGNAPTGDAKVSVLMEQTTSDTPDDPEGKVGTCASAVTDDCVAPSYTFPVTDTWTQIKVAWSDFSLGSAVGIPVSADGSNIWQLQFDVALEWVQSDAGDYEPAPGEYELVVDSMTFY
jgi:hypothetical protein